MSGRLPEFLKLRTLTDAYGPYVGAVCLFTFSLWVVEIVVAFGGKIAEWIRSEMRKKEVLDHLDSLNSHEADLLRVALDGGVCTISYRAETFQVSSLIAKGLIESVPRDHPKTMLMPYTIPFFVWRHINTKSGAAKIASKIKIDEP